MTNNLLFLITKILELLPLASILSDSEAVIKNPHFQPKSKEIYRVLAITNCFPISVPTIKTN